MYHVELEDFEGPLDLLLFLIKREELDVYDIPIARITDEYLRYVRVIEQIDLDGAGEFIYMAAVLINIKARTLLPISDEDGEGEEEDPRRQLVERLLEYMRHKEVAERLNEHKRERSELYARGEAADQHEEFDRAPEELEYQVSVFDLVSVLADVLEERDETEPVHEVHSYEYSVEEQQEFVVERLAQEGRSSFSDLVIDRSKQFVIATFLAILELAKEGTVQVATNVDWDDFFVESQQADIAA